MIHVVLPLDVWQVALAQAAVHHLGHRLGQADLAVDVRPSPAPAPPPEAAVLRRSLERAQVSTPGQRRPRAPDAAM